MGTSRCTNEPGLTSKHSVLKPLVSLAPKDVGEELAAAAEPTLHLSALI